MEPFIINAVGFADLASILGEVKAALGAACSRRIVLPGVLLWIVTQWHYGRDGSNKVAGPRFELEFGRFGEAIVKAYVKEIRGRPTVRMERIETPQKSFGDIISERLDGATPC
jgi:hypothetical protein